MNTRFLLRESAKSGVRGALRRFDLGVVRGPFDSQVVRAANWLGVVDVLDVGANIGQYGHALLSGGYGGRVTSCEPLADAYARLARRASRHPRWRTVRTAIGSHAGTITINVSANSYSSSVLPISDAHVAADGTSQTVGSELVPMTTVDLIVGEHGIVPDKTLLKIDTQGFEGAVLEGATETITGFPAVQLEMSFVPLYEGQELFETLDKRMTAAGFQLFTMAAGLSDDSTGRLLQADVLYVARTRLPDEQ